MPILGVDKNPCDAKHDLFVFDSENLWNVLFERLKNQSTLANKEFTVDAARDVNNRWKNRYRDITPYDSTRVFLDSGLDGDYINASYVEIPAAPSRKYILTQGPMQLTVSHFWQMVWERQSPAIVMLNRIFEKGTMKCYPYFPFKGGSTKISLDGVGLNVQLEQESNHQHFVQRNFVLTNTKTNEQHQLIHLHYTDWPDFGVPCSPSGFLNFLWSVRGSGALNDPDHPAVIHCSAGVGRSGAFVLIDLALHLVETRGTLKGIDLAELFVDLRRCRMGIIQTSDQLRFCYSAVVRGAEEILAVSPDRIPFIHFQPDAAENYQINLSSDSDDGWEGLGEGEYDSFVDDDDDGIVGRLNDEADPDFEPMGNEDESGATTRLRHTDPVRDDSLLLNDVLPSQSTALCLDSSRVASERAGEVSAAAPVTTRFTGGSFGCRATKSNAIYWISESNKPTIGPSAAITVDHGAKVVGHPVNKLYLRSMVRDRSNNALSIGLSDEVDQAFTSNQDSHELIPLMEAAGIVTHSTIAHMPHNELTASTEEVVCTANGDNFHPDRDHQNTLIASSVPLANAVSNVPSSGTSLDPLTSAYLEASLDLRERRDARRLRLARIRERVEATRERMRTADLERKRWIPAWAMHYLRRFFAESGYVRSPVGAAISTTLFLLITVGVTTLVYSYWFSV